LPEADGLMIAGTRNTGGVVTPHMGIFTGAVTGSYCFALDVVDLAGVSG
jgi:hypothetical protein